MTFAGNTAKACKWKIAAFKLVKLYIPPLPVARCPVAPPGACLEPESLSTIFKPLKLYRATCACLCSAAPMHPDPGQEASEHRAGLLGCRTQPVLTGMSETPVSLKRLAMLNKQKRPLHRLLSPHPGTGPRASALTCLPSLPSARRLKPGQMHAVHRCPWPTWELRTGSLICCRGMPVQCSLKHRCCRRLCPSAEHDSPAGPRRSPQAGGTLGQCGPQCG